MKGRQQRPRKTPRSRTSRKAQRRSEAPADDSRTTGRILRVDARGLPGSDVVRSPREALKRLMEDSYTAIELHTDLPGDAEYDLLRYLSEVWPGYLEKLTVRLIQTGRPPMIWSAPEKRFVMQTPRIISPVAAGQVIDEPARNSRAGAELRRDGAQSEPKPRSSA